MHHNFLRYSGLILIFLLAACSSSGIKFDTTKAHHGEDRFISGKTSFFFPWLSMRLKEGTVPAIDPEQVETIVGSVDRRLIESPADTPRATWIGHATALVQYQGINFLTDPHLTQYPFKYDFWVDKRFTQPALTFDEMPDIAFVVISHNHFDHLDHRTVDLFKNSVTWFVPLGLKAWFLDRGIDDKKVVELDWWESYQFDEQTVITFAPSVHWSKRSLWNNNESLWGSWSVNIDGFKTWFAGDTGYDDQVFKAIGQRLGPFRLGLIPIGAYAPRYFMADSHVDPQDAVKIHQDIRSRQSMPIHWGTFQLSHEPILEPPAQLTDELKRLQIPLRDFEPIKIGNTLILN